MKRIALLLLAACGNEPGPPPSAPVAVDVPPMPASAASPRLQSPPPNPDPYVAREPTAEPAPTASAGPTSSGGRSFDKGAAAAALQGAQIQRCSMPGGPTGMGHATVTFEPSGRVASATIDAGPYAGTPVGGCLAKVYSTITVPPFTGAPVRVGKSFVLP